jgi:hypothetical protein
MPLSIRIYFTLSGCRLRPLDEDKLVRVRLHRGIADRRQRKLKTNNR